MFDLAHLQCPVCHHTLLHEITDGDQTLIQCAQCQVRYDVVRGIPFLGRYGEEDIPGLIEIAANAENYSRTPEGAPLHLIREHFEQFEAFHHALNQAARLKQMTGSTYAGFVTRYREWLVARLLLDGIPAKVGAVLDVGAGTGYGSYRFLDRAESITCFDYSPILSAQGLANLPQARWFCGVAPVLPFADESFDVVTAWEALHHIRDARATLEQMLRVLKPGGYLLTAGDSFRPAASADDYVVRAYEHSPDVLLGVNEGIPRISEFLAVLQQYQAALTVEIITSEEQGRDVFKLRCWTLKDALAELPAAKGVIGMRVMKRQSLAIAPLTAAPAIIGAAEYDRVLDTQTSAMTHLVNLLPERLLDLPFNGAQEPLFRLLNGWKLPGTRYRTAYKRARLYLRRHAAYLQLRVCAPYVEGDTPTIIILVNGQDICQTPLVRGLWTTVSAALPEHTERMTVEIRLETDSDHYLFHVSAVQQVNQPDTPAPVPADIEQYSLPTLAAVGLLPDTLTVMLTPNFIQNITILNQLRALKRHIQVITAPGQEAIFTIEVGVKVVGAYQQANIQPLLLVAQDHAEADQQARRLPMPPRYWITPQGLVTPFTPLAPSAALKAALRRRLKPALKKLAQRMFG